MTAGLSTAPAASATVLVVEDDPGIAELERDRLTEAGYRVLVADTADAALREVAGGGIDLVLLDYRLPGGVDGLDFYARVKAAGYDLPVILVTGFGNEATVIRALRIGVRDFVTKSLEYLDYLPEAVDRVLRQVGTERRLADSEARLAGIIGSAKDAVIVVEDDRRVSLFNTAAERMFGCPAADALGRPLTDFIPNEFAPDDDRTGEATRTHRLRLGSRGLRADGREFPLEATFAAGRASGRRFHTVVARDITDRRQLEEQLRQAQKMEAVGQLAGGIAHDFNNLLTVINGYCDLLLNTLPAGDPARESVAEILSAGERSAAFTRQLLAFSRRAVVAPKSLVLSAVVAEAEKLLRRLLGSDVLLSVAADPDLGTVKADPGQVEQVLLNLCVNARDAMPTGGRLAIETRNVHLAEGYVATHPEALPGPHVLLAVSDTGTGIPPDVRDRIFEPFFTTKPPGKGTGLGLATVYGIVRQSGGHLVVESEVGKGTTFKVYLPRTEKAGLPALGAVSPAAPVRGTGTVLLLEDDAAVRALASRILTGCGYTVLDASTVGEAEQHAARAVRLDLFLTDVVLPDGGGRAAAERVSALHPAVKILFMSGYPDDAVVRHGVVQEKMHFLQKPFPASVLAAKVREVLAAT